MIVKSCKISWYLIFGEFSAKNRVTNIEIVRRVEVNNNKAPGLFSER